MKGKRNGKLCECLAKINARRIYQMEINSTSQISMWTAQAKTFVLTEFFFDERDSNGFEIYIPASKSSFIDTTIAALENYIEELEGEELEEEISVF